MHYQKAYLTLCAPQKHTKKNIERTKEKNQKVSVCYLLLLRKIRKETILYIQDWQKSFCTL